MGQQRGGKQFSNRCEIEDSVCVDRPVEPRVRFAVVVEQYAPAGMQRHGNAAMAVVRQHILYIARDDPLEIAAIGLGTPCAKTKKTDDRREESRADQSALRDG